MKVALSGVVNKLVTIEQALLEVRLLRFKIEVKDKATSRRGAVLHSGISVVVHVNRESCGRYLEGTYVVLVAEARSLA